MKIKINLLIIALVAMIVMAASGCGDTASNKNGSNQNSAHADTNANKAASTPAADQPLSTVSTPVDAYKAAYNARKNKDVPALKKLMSKDIMEFFGEIAGLGEQPQTVDEMLKELCDKPQAPTAETRNLKIDGDKATLEYLDEKGGWSTMDFIKEDGMWKLTIPIPEDGAPRMNTAPPAKNDKNS